MPLSTATALLWAVATLGIYWVAWIIYARTFHPLSSVPGPFFASISRLWVMYHHMRGGFVEYQRSLHKRYGPLVRLGPNEVACASPDEIKKIYPTSKPLTKTDFYPVWRAPGMSKYPDVFSETDEKQHAERRRIINPVYSMSNVLQAENYIDKCTTLFMERMGEYADKGEVIDLGQWLQMCVYVHLRAEKHIVS